MGSMVESSPAQHSPIQVSQSMLRHSNRARAKCAIITASIQSSLDMPFRGNEKDFVGGRCGCCNR
jgi:hypothetical protein